MGLETITGGIQDLNPTWPLAIDYKNQGDDHLRAIKNAIALTFPNAVGAWRTTQKMSGLGYDAQNGRVQHIGAATEPDDAVRKEITDYLATLIGAIHVRVQYLEGSRLWGTVSAAGAKLGGSDGWTVSKPGVGQYVINYPAQAVFHARGLTATVQGNASGIISIAPNSLSADNIFTYSQAGNPIDKQFGFVLVLPA